MGGRGRWRLGPLGTGPWLRAPLLLLRRPVVFSAVAVATAVLAIAASSGVLFTSTLGTASLNAQAADDCPELSMPAFQAYLRPGALPAQNAAGLRAMRREDVSAHPYWVDVASSRIQDSRVTLYARTGALAHLQLLSPDTGAPGAWFPDNFAVKLDLHPGDTIVNTDGTPIRVAGIYRSLSPDPFHLANVPRYWCTWNDLIVQKVSPGNGPGTPPLLVCDPATIDTVIAGAERPDAPPATISASWYAPLPADRSIADARTHVRRAVHAWARYLGGSGSALKQDPRTGAYLRPTAAPKDDPLSSKIEIAEQVRGGLAGSVLPIDLSGAVIALLLVAGAGGFWAAHRSREIRLLSARGVGPVAMAVKALLETLPATVLGLVAGVAAMVALVRAVGPADVFTPGALARAGGAAVLAVLVGLAVIAGIGAAAARDTTAATRRRSRRRVLLRRTPVELALVGLASWAWLRIRSGSGIGFAHAIVDIHPLLLLFPLLGLTGLLLFAGRLLTALVPRLARLASRLGRAGYLALRRVGGSRAIAIGLLIGTALPCGLLAYAGTVRTGVHQELVRKYQTNLGAPDAFVVIGARNAPLGLHGAGTPVAMYLTGARTGDGTGVTVLGVDPATFARFAYTTAGQRHDVSLLRGGPPSGPRPAVLVNAAAAADPHSVRLGATTLDVHIVARSDVFPGLRNSTAPMLVVDRAALAHVDVQADRRNEAWTNDAGVAAVSKAVRDRGYSILTHVDPQITVGRSGLLPITWIFGYVRALAILIGAVAIAGLVFALSARTRRRTVAYVMSRRMGLTQGTHLRSLLIELGGVVGLGWVLGTGLGFAGYAVLTGSLDLAPDLPPGAQMEVPVTTLVVTAGVVAVVIAVAALGSHAAAERADPADILRLE